MAGEWHIGMDICVSAALETTWGPMSSLSSDKCEGESYLHMRHQCSLEVGPIQPSCSAAGGRSQEQQLGENGELP